jgi:uncharacterized protein
MLKTYYNMFEEIESQIDWENLFQNANSGNPKAQFEVGYYFENGLIRNNQIIVSPNLETSFQWYQKASQNGDIDAMSRYADFLSGGYGCELDYNAAIAVYADAIEGGSTIALENLGMTYRDLGDYKKAFHYYSLFQQMEETDCSLTMALCYYYGIGTDFDFERCVEILNNISEDVFQKNSQSEIDEANYLLGKLYFEGKILEKSVVKARYYLNLANKDDDHNSAKELLFAIGKR